VTTNSKVIEKKESVFRKVRHLLRYEPAYLQGEKSGLPGLSYGEVNRKFENVSAAFRDFSQVFGELWNEMLQSVERRDYAMAKLTTDLVALARSAIFVVEFANERLDRLTTIENAENQTALNFLTESLALLAEGARETLRSSHVEVLQAVPGEAYDPDFHDCKRAIPSRAGRGTVVKVLENGFIYKGELSPVLVRSVGVAVSSGKLVDEQGSTTDCSTQKERNEGDKA